MMFYLITTVFGITCLAIVSDAFPVNENYDAAMLYLQKFGYLEDESINHAAFLNAEDAISAAIKKFQRFTGLRETGELDVNTIATMNAPRCGVKDTIRHSESARKKRYTLQGSKWRVHLTYRISKYPPWITDQAIVDNEIDRAFKIWSNVTTLNLKKKATGRVNIDIRFEDRQHGDGYPFDGPDKTLAHAFYPQYGGDVHFDNEEEWTINENGGKNLFQVATHEFGHSLGLSHSDEKMAIMYPIYTGYNPRFTIYSDDIKAIQTLYGSQDQPASPVDDENNLEPVPDAGNAPNLCQDAALDTAIRLENGITYIFKGYFYWKYLSDAIADGYPRQISDDWDGLEGNLDAAFSLSSGKTFFFKGRRYWRFTNTTKDRGYPKLISEGFKGIPDMLDAALVWNGNGKIYFFKDDKYWRYDSNNDLSITESVSKNYPMSISEWKGLPVNGIDAALKWENNVSYFFKGKKYYRFNDATSEVENWDPPYPRSTASEWFNC